MLELIDVAKHYGTTPALSPARLTIAGGRTTVLIGPSGCGKSTLLRLIAGLVEADQGTIRVDGEVLTPVNINNMRHRMGYVIQEGGLFPHLTVQRNVDLMARYLGWSATRIEARTAELAELVQLQPSLLRRFPAELSGGQRQRVSLMRALMLDPELLLLDEPLGALDPIIRYELQQELRAIFARLTKTVVMVTHDIAEAAFFGHTLVLMRDGRIIQQGSVRDLARSPAEPFVEQFINAQREPARQLGEALS
ncbi:MAG: ATP-binding cassette domain-containing protein [Pseudomonadota bacterium]|nr:MAG: ATP-binding cassette domain-containing protein [Pseudomonadota bacterium]